MSNLIKFEIKKMVSQKIFLVGLALIVFYNIMLFRSESVPSMSVLPDINSDLVYGINAVELDKGIASKYEGLLTDNKVQQMLSDFYSQPLYERFGGLRVDSIPRNSMQVAVQSRFANADGSWSGNTVRDVFGDSEILVGYTSGWLATSAYMIKVIIALGFLMILLIAPVFSGEYAGMDALILTSKYGKSKCISAKITASYLVAFLITALFVFTNVVLAHICYGSDGLNASVGFAANRFFESIPVDISCGSLLQYQILLSFTSIMTIAGATMLISSLTKNAFIALAISVVIQVLPLALSASEQSPMYKFIVLSPVLQGQLVSILTIGKATLFGISAHHAMMALPLAVAIGILSCMMTRRVFRRHQVS